MRRTRRTSAAAGLGLVMAAALAGCTGSGGGYAVLDAEPVADAPALPELPEDAFAEVAAPDLRFAGEHEGTTLWVGTGDEKTGICLLVVEEGDDWLVSCGGGNGPLEVRNSTGTYRLQADGVEVPDGWTAVSENVLVRGD